MIIPCGTGVKGTAPLSLRASIRRFRYTNSMSETQQPSPEDQVRHAISLSSFLLERREAMRSLFHGKLFDVVPGSTKKHGKEWRNVAEHCIAVGRALDTLGRMLGIPDADRERIVQVGLVHDWDKRLRKDKTSFAPAEQEKALAYAKGILATHDPDGRLYDATEPQGLKRLEDGTADPLEHLVHLVDLSCMPEGLVPPEKRIADLRMRHAAIDYDAVHPDFWKRKEALALREERTILELLRAAGRDVPEGKRLCDILNEEMAGK